MPGNLLGRYAGSAIIVKQGRIIDESGYRPCLAGRLYERLRRLSLAEVSRNSLYGIAFIA